MNADPPASPEGEADGGQVCTDRAIIVQLLLVLTSVVSICVYLRKSVAKLKTKCADKVTQVRLFILLHMLCHEGRRLKRPPYDLIGCRKNSIRIRQHYGTLHR